MSRMLECDYPVHSEDRSAMLGNELKPVSTQVRNTNTSKLKADESSGHWITTTARGAILPASWPGSELGLVGKQKPAYRKHQLPTLY